MGARAEEAIAKAKSPAAKQKILWREAEKIHDGIGGSALDGASELSREWNNYFERRSAGLPAGEDAKPARPKRKTKKPVRENHGDGVIVAEPADDPPLEVGEWLDHLT